MEESEPPLDLADPEEVEPEPEEQEGPEPAVGAKEKKPPPVIGLTRTSPLSPCALTSFPTVSQIFELFINVAFRG